jgi:uncharacterized protein (TIGR03435 family)
MWRQMGITGVMLAAAGVSFGQPAELPAFEVASVKVDTGGQAQERHIPFKSNVKTSPVSVTMINVSLKAAIQWAYHAFPYQVNGPGWMDSTHFDIMAKAAGASTDEQLRQMMQRLLAERFKVAVHHEVKEMPCYIVTVSKTGIKFQKSGEEGDPEIKPDGQFKIALKKITMQQLADEIGNTPIPDPVVDQTGLTGTYDIALDISKFANTMDKPSGIDEVISVLAQAIKEQLGLTIEHHKAPIDMVIVDHAEKVPIDN